MGRKKPTQYLEEEHASMARLRPARNFYLLLENVRSMQNVGAIFRTADAFSAKGLILCGITGRPPHREIYRTALGAEQSVPWEYFPSAQEALRAYMAKGAIPVALEQTFSSINLALWPQQSRKAYPLAQHFVLVLGNEVEGVSESTLSLCQHCLEIPQFGQKHSLNVAVAAGIAMWEFARSCPEDSLEAPETLVC